MTADTTRPVRPRPAPADGDAGDAEDLAGEDRRPRYTMWAGGMAATALVVLALWGGAHLSVLLPGMRPAWLAGIVGVVLAWVVVAVLGWCAAELLKTHHRAMRAAAWRGTRRGGAWAWRTGRHHGARAVVWAGGRWQQRQLGPLLLRRLLPHEEIEALDQAEPCPECGAGIGEPCAPGCRGGYPSPGEDLDDGTATAAGGSGDAICPDCGQPLAGHPEFCQRYRPEPGGGIRVPAPEDATCVRIAAAVARAWGMRPLHVKRASGAIDGPDHYYVCLPPGVLTVPRERARVPAELAAAAGILAGDLGEPAEIVDGWHTADGPVVVLHTGAPQPAGPEPKPASGDPAGRTVYMTRVRLAAGGRETTT